MAQPKNILDVVNNLNPFEVSWDPRAFDDLILAHAIKFIHYQSIPCPGSTSERSSNRSRHQDHNCLNGFYYINPKPFSGVLTNNPSSKSNRPEGRLDISTALILLPRYYDCPDSDDVIQERMYFTAYDRVELNDKNVLVSYFEVIEPNQTGIDRTRFPVCQPVALIDAYGKQYQFGTDYNIFDGAVRWIGQNRPQFNLSTGEGIPYSIRYLYRPCWYVVRNLHEIRILNTTDDEGNHASVRYPMQLEVVREVDYLSGDNDPNQNTDSRDGVGPGSGRNFSPK